MDEDDLYEIAIAHSDGLEQSIAEPLLRAAVVETLRRHNVQHASVSIALVGDSQIARLNETHLGHIGPTDVLTFDLRDDDATPRQVDGEIVISAETAQREADQRGHEPSAEIALYAVHGVLHLLGYDDHSQEDSARMHESEDAILTALNIGPVFRGPTT